MFVTFVLKAPKPNVFVNSFLNAGKTCLWVFLKHAITSLHQLKHAPCLAGFDQLLLSKRLLHCFTAEPLPANQTPLVWTIRHQGNRTVHEVFPLGWGCSLQLLLKWETGRRLPHKTCYKRCVSPLWLRTMRNIERRLADGFKLKMAWRTLWTK